MKSERKPKTPLIASHSAKKNVQKSAPPNGKKARGSRVFKGTDGLLDISNLPEQNPDPVMRFTRDGEPLFGNPAAALLLSFADPDTFPVQWREIATSTFESASNREVEIEHDGKIFSALFVPIQRAGYVNVYCRDITERRRIRAALLESEERMRLATQAARVCTWELNIRDQSYKLGDNFAEVVGFSPDLLPTNSNEVSDMLIVPEDMHAVRETVIQAVQTRSEVPPLQSRVKHPETAEIIWLEVNAKLVYDTEGKPLRMFGLVQNITARKAAENERNQLLQLEQTQRANAERSKFEVEQARTKAEQELAERRLAEAALGAWTEAPLPQEARPVWLRYGMAFVATAIAILVRQLLDPLLGSSVQYVPIIGAVAFSVWYGGVGPALLSALFGYLGISWLLLNGTPFLAPDIAEFASLGVFLISSTIVMALGDTMRRAQRHAHQSAGVAVKRQQQLELRLLEQKRAEEALRRSEALYRTIARSIPGGGIYVVDKDFRYLVAEGPVTEAFGLSREMLEGHTVAEVFPGESAETLEARLRRNLAGETVSYETPHNGRVFWTQQAPLRDSIGQVIIVTMDITERKRAEEALKQSEERFRRFMEHLPGLAWIKDLQGYYVYANAAAAKAFQTPREKLYGKTDAEVFPPDVAAQFIQNDALALLDEKGVQVVEELRHEDGILHYSLVNKFPIPGPDGKVALLGGTAIDITERKRAEAELRQAREGAEATADRIARLQEITSALAGSLTAGQLSELILEQGTRATGAAASVLVEVVNDGKGLKTVAALGYPSAAIQTEPSPLSRHTPMSDCIRSGQTVWIESHNEFAAQYPSLAETRRGLGNEATVALPLIVGNRVLGGLAFSFAEKREFLLEERGFLLAIAQQYAQGLERVRTTAALRDSEARYRFIVENTSDGIWWIELNEPMPVTLSVEEQIKWYYHHAVMRQCNLELARMYGYDSVEEVTGLPIRMIRLPGLSMELTRQFIRSNYRLVDAESYEKDKDGRDLVFLNNMIGIVEDGKLKGEWGTNRDITERKRAEARLVLLAEVSELTREIEDPGQLMPAVASMVGRHLHVQRCLFNEIDVENDLEIVHDDFHDDVESVKGRHKLTDYSSITSAEMIAGKTVVNYDAMTDPRTAEDYERSYVPNGERAYVAVPLLRDETWLASLWVSDDKPRQWSSEEVALLETIAERTWTATEKLRIHVALRDSEERLRVTFNTTAVGFAMLAPDTRFTDVNTAFCEIVGYAREELLRMPFDYLTHPDYLKSTRDHLDRLLAGEVPSFVIEKLYIRKDGTEIWVLNNISLVRNVDGEPLHLIVISQDITERKRVEDELQRLNILLEERVEKRTLQLKTAGQLRRMEMVERRQAEDRFTKSFNASPIAMSITRFEDGMYRNVNPKFMQLLGYKQDEIIGHTPVELMVYKSIDERLDILRLLRENRSRWSYETQLQTKTGEIRDVSISMVEIELDGEPHLLSSIMDITERNQILAALRASEQQLRTLFDVLPVGVSYVRPNGEVIEANRTLEKILEITHEELESDTYKKRQYIRIDGTPMPPTEFASSRALTEQRTIKNVETGILKEGGQVIWVSDSATPISMPEPGAVVITMDVTERKHMDDELRRSHKRYQILSQRLVEIQEEERRTISRELHDRVGQSLAALNLNLNFLSSQIPRDTEVHVRSRLKDAIQLTEETVSTIRDVMADLRPPALDDYGLEAALNAYVDVFSRRSGIQVTLNKAATSMPRLNPSIELTLLRIVQEALTNVARHARANRASITLAIHDNLVYLTIEDNGEGIRSWQKANRPGSHGLKIMRERAETFGGSLHVQSFSQKGTRIEVKIPIVDADQSNGRAEAD